MIIFNNFIPVNFKFKVKKNYFIKHPNKINYLEYFSTKSAQIILNMVIINYIYQ